MASSSRLATLDVTSTSTETVSTTASGTNTKAAATGVGVAVALNFVDVSNSSFLSGTGSLIAADAINVSSMLAGEGGFTASATSGAGDSSKSALRVR